MLRQFCKPVRESDSRIKSSAYKIEFDFVPFGKVKGSDNVFSNENGKSLKYKLKSKGHPWRTPLAY